MPESGRGQPTVVNVGACRCPGGAHDPIGDTVTLHPEPTTPLGVAAWTVVEMGGSLPTLQGRLASVYMELGIADWTFTDERGAAIPVTPDNIARLLPFGRGGQEVWTAADALYTDTVVTPLVARMSKPSAPTPTDDSTSPSPSSSDGPPEPSLPSPPRAHRGKPSAVPVP